MPNPESLEYLLRLGFTDTQASKALEATDNNVERAVDWIFSHQGDDAGAAAPMEEDSAARPAEPSFRDGNGREYIDAILSL